MKLIGKKSCKNSAGLEPVWAMGTVTCWWDEAADAAGYSVRCSIENGGFIQSSHTLRYVNEDNINQFTGKGYRWRPGGRQQPKEAVLPV